MIYLILLIVAWIGAVGLDLGSTLRFVYRWGWKWEGNYLPRKMLKRLVQTGNLGYIVVYTTFYISMVPLVLLFYPVPSFQALGFEARARAMFFFPAFVYYVGFWNLFLVNRVNKKMRRGTRHTIFGKQMKTKTWRIPYMSRRIKHFDS